MIKICRNITGFEQNIINWITIGIILFVVNIKEAQKKQDADYEKQLRY